MCPALKFISTQNVTLFGIGFLQMCMSSRMSSYWIRASPNSVTGVLIKRRKLRQTEACRRTPCDNGGQVEWSLLRPRNMTDCQQLGECTTRGGGPSLGPPEGTWPCCHLPPLYTCSLLNGERIHFCCHGNPTNWTQSPLPWNTHRLLLASLLQEVTRATQHDLSS
jgi:hypothetical protein